jgi:hypothetical protein
MWWSDICSHFPSRGVGFSITNPECGVEPGWVFYSILFSPSVQRSVTGTASGQTDRYANWGRLSDQPRDPCTVRDLVAWLSLMHGGRGSSPRKSSRQPDVRLCRSGLLLHLWFTGVFMQIRMWVYSESITSRTDSLFVWARLCYNDSSASEDRYLGKHVVADT